MLVGVFRHWEVRSSLRVVWDGDLYFGEVVWWKEAASGLVMTVGGWGG